MSLIQLIRNSILCFWGTEYTLIVLYREHNISSKKTAAGSTVPICFCTYISCIQLYLHADGLRSPGGSPFYNSVITILLCLHGSGSFSIHSRFSRTTFMVPLQAMMPYIILSTMAITAAPSASDLASASSMELPLIP
jgi:hypothetical protein